MRVIYVSFLRPLRGLLPDGQEAVALPARQPLLPGRGPQREAPVRKAAGPWEVRVRHGHPRVLETRKPGM